LRRGNDGDRTTKNWWQFSEADCPQHDFPLRHFVSALVGFILIPMFTKYLGAAQYGVWVLAQSVVSYLSLLEFGLTTTLTRHLAAAKATGDYDQANRILGQLATMMWGVGFF